jgi:transposase InsO family protein
VLYQRTKSRNHSRAIFKTDQGSQFTSEAFTGVLLDAGISISMDGRGRALDNIFVERLWRTVKYEDIYLKSLPGSLAVMIRDTAHPLENPYKLSSRPSLVFRSMRLSLVSAATSNPRCRKKSTKSARSSEP